MQDKPRRTELLVTWFYHFELLWKVHPKLKTTRFWFPLFMHWHFRMDN